MTTIIKNPLLLGAVTMLGISMMAPAPALAADRPCRGIIGAITLDGVQVPPGATCTLDGTLVKGNVTVQKGANRTPTAYTNRLEVLSAWQTHARS